MLPERHGLWRCLSWLGQQASPGPASRAFLALHILAVHILAVNINDEPVRVGQQESVVARQVVHFQHNPRAPRLKFGNSNFLQEAIVHVEGLAHQGRSQFGVAQVEENAVGMRDALGIELHLLLDINGHASVVGRGPVANSGNARQGAATGARACRFGDRFGRVASAGIVLALEDLCWRAFSAVRSISSASASISFTAERASSASRLRG